MPRWRMPRIRHWPLIPVVALAFLVRVWNAFPLFVYGDDAQYAIVATYLADDALRLAYPVIEGFGPTPFVSQPPLLLYLFAMSAAFAPDAESGAAFMSILLGTLTVAAAYGIGNRLQGRTMGFLAALFLAVLPAHVSLSRMPFLDVGMTCFMTLAVYAFLRWLDAPTRARALLVGLAAAAAMLAKLPGIVILVPLVVGFGLYVARRAQETGSLRKAWQEGKISAHLTTAAAPGVLLGSMYVGLLWYLNSTRDLLAKLGRQWSRVAGEQDPASALPDRPWHYYFTDSMGGIPSGIGVVLSLLAVAGLVYVVRLAIKTRSIAWITVLVWWASILAFLTLSGRKEWFYVLPAFVPTLLMAAAPVFPALDRLRASGAEFAGFSAKSARVFMAVVLVVATTAIAQPAFAMTDKVVFAERTFGYGTKEAAVFIGEKDPGAGQVGSLLGRYALHYYNGHPTYHWFTDHELVNESIEKGETRFVVIDLHLPLEHEEAWMRGLVDAYNGTLVASFRQGLEQPLVLVYELHPTDPSGGA